jgi:hypothetical protein
MLDAFIATQSNDLMQLTMNEAMESGGRPGGFEECKERMEWWGVKRFGASSRC